MCLVCCLLVVVCVFFVKRVYVVCLRIAVWCCLLVCVVCNVCLCSVECVCGLLVACYVELYVVVRFCVVMCVCFVCDDLCDVIWFVWFCLSLCV